MQEKHHGGKVSVTSIYLIRHAQSVGNAGKRFQGRLDHPLTPEGEAQTGQVAKRFCAIPLAAVYTSPLSRARRTAEAIAASRGLAPIPDDRLLEMDLGDFEDRGFDDIRVRYPGALELFFDEPHRFAGVAGGEDFFEVTERVVAAVEEIAAKHRGANVAVVTHGCALRCLFCHFMGYPMERMPEVPWSRNTGVNHLAYVGGKPRFLSVADLSHLEGAQ